jgi:hypothetical protein
VRHLLDDGDGRPVSSGAGCPADPVNVRRHEGGQVVGDDVIDGAAKKVASWNDMSRPYDLELNVSGFLYFAMLPPPPGPLPPLKRRKL